MHVAKNIFELLDIQNQTFENANFKNYKDDFCCISFLVDRNCGSCCQELSEVLLVIRRSGSEHCTTTLPPMRMKCPSWTAT